MFPTTKNTQRLASLALVASLASASRSTSLQTLADDYANLLTRRVIVDVHDRPRVTDYLRKRNLLRKYGEDLRTIESQDWFLSDPSLPSGTGAEKGDTRGAVELCVQLGLLWPESHQRTWLGDFVVRAGPDMPQDFEERKSNPFILSTGRRLALEWTFTRRDADFLAFLMGIIRQEAQPVGMVVIEAAIRSTFPDFVKGLASRECAARDPSVLKRLREIEQRLQAPTIGRKSRPGGITEQTSRRLIEELVFFRLEALVDIGYVVKTHRLSYDYSLHPKASGLGGVLNAEAHSRSFFQSWRRSNGELRQITPLEGPAALEALFEANKIKANAMGYTLIEQGVLIANDQLASQERPEVVELAAATRALTEGLEQFRVLTSVDRRGVLSAYKIQAR
jgi:hypothetical protein